MIKKKDNMAGKIALGVTGAALAAGAVAAGAALSKKENRAALKRGVKKAARKINEVREAIDEGRAKYQAFSHRVKMVGKKTRLGLGKGRKKIKKGI